MPRASYQHHRGKLRGRAPRAAGAARLRSGFSIIELLLVIMIISITTAIALPKLRGIGLGTDVVSAQSALVSRVARARATAVQTGRPTRLYFHADSVWTGTVASNGAVTRVGSLLNLRGQFNVTAVVRPANNSFIQFDPRGIATAAGSPMVNLTLQRDATHTGRFCVTRHGRVVRGAQLTADCPVT